MIKKSLPILIAAVILFLGYRMFVSQPQVKNKSIPYDTIICFGDSLTYGTGAVPGMDYPSQLSKMISKPVINAGVPGDTTASALTRLQRDVLSRFPDVVLITLGGNDLKNGVAKEVAFKNLKRIVESIQGQGARVVIGGLKFPFRDRGFARGYEDLADQTGAVLIPDIFKDIIGNRRLMSDLIHPNGNGYKIMAQRFLEAMPPR
jgi:lysophospholipase L1-like esterase